MEMNATVKRNIAITGATGFLGKAIVERLALDGHKIKVISRGPVSMGGVDSVAKGDFLASAPDPKILEGQDLLIHLAGQASGDDAGTDPKTSKNATMTRNVAIAARASKVPYVLSMSSWFAGVAEIDPNRVRQYGLEKLEADKAMSAELDSSQKLILLRPPAIYGIGMKGGLGTLAKLVKKGMPLPLGLAREPRPYFALENLTDLVSTISSLDSEKWTPVDRCALAVNDGDWVSTVDLVKMIGEVLDRPVRLLPVPRQILTPLLSALGKSEHVRSAFDSLPKLDGPDASNAFNWKPVSQMPDSLKFLLQE